MLKKPLKKPKKKPVKFFLAYRFLMNGYPDWGVEFERKKDYKEAMKSPSDSILTFAFLTVIVDLLREIRKEVKEPKTLK